MTTLLKENCKRPIELDTSAPLLGSDHHSDGYDRYQCGYLFANWGIEDVWIGLILLVVSLACLLLCLYGLMRVLNSLMEDQGMNIHVVTNIRFIQASVREISLKWDVTISSN